MASCDARSRGEELFSRGARRFAFQKCFRPLGLKLESFTVNGARVARLDPGNMCSELHTGSKGVIYSKKYSQVSTTL
eukprot:31341-Pelagococcus_subviridis.AAC.7